MVKPRDILLTILSLVFLTGEAFTQTPDVTVSVSNRETYVGVPITLTITIHNTNRYTLPDPIEVAGARVQPRSGPSTNSMTQIINGRMTSTSSTIFEYRVIPNAPGVISIPSFSFTVDGQARQSNPIEVLVNEIDMEEGDTELLILEIASDRDTYYLGEPAEVTLRIWIKPYRDTTYNLTVKRDDMWSMINGNLSTWGEFTDEINKLRRNSFGGVRNLFAPPLGGETLRTDKEGNRRSYYFYELPATIWPKQPGELLLDDLLVMMEYATRLGVRREFLRERLTITESKLLAAKVEPSSIFIRPTPEEGRPESFTGAVGSYTLTVQAQPTEITVGDPITIAIDIHDRTGRSRLDVLQPPALDATSELTENFRIPTDPLAGEVLGATKRFVQTLRAVSDSVSRIPPIQFAYFDPDRKTYVTIESDPIPLTVRPASNLAMTDIVEAPGGAPPSQAGPSQLTRISGGVLANYTGAEALLKSQTLTFGLAQTGLLIASPLLVGIIVLARRRSERYRTDERYARKRSARRTALRRLDDVADDEPASQMDGVTDALSGYIADRCHLPAGAHTRSELIRQLESRNVAEELITRINDLLSECERSRYAGVTSEGVSDAAQRVRDLVTRLEKEPIA